MWCWYTDAYAHIFALALPNSIYVYSVVVSCRVVHSAVYKSRLVSIDRFVISKPLTLSSDKSYLCVLDTLRKKR